MDDICNLLTNSFPKKEDEIIRNDISTITITDKKESRTEKAQDYYIKLYHFLNDVNNHEYFKSITIMQHITSIFTEYFEELFPENWPDMYHRIGQSHYIQDYSKIEDKFKMFFNTPNTPENIIEKLYISKQIFLDLFRLSGVFPEFYEN